MRKTLFALTVGLALGLLVDAGRAQINVPPIGFSPSPMSTQPMAFVNGAGVANGPILATAGTVSAPSISFAGDPDTGFLSELANVVSVTAGGTRSMLLQGGGVMNLRGNSAQINFGTSDDFAITRIAAGQYGITAVLFASLGTPANGTFCYCSDCTIANPCAGSGTGAFAKRLNGVWVCN